MISDQTLHQNASSCDVNGPCANFTNGKMHRSLAYFSLQQTKVNLSESNLLSRNADSAD